MLMTCSETQKNIKAFLEDRLPAKEVYDFMKHIETCSECYDELEVHFMVNEAQKAFSDDEPESYNLRPQFLLMLENKKKWLRKNTLCLIGGIALAVFVVGVAVFAFLSLH